MATILDKLKWDNYHRKKRKLTVYGLNNGLIFPYSDEIIEKFRKIYYGGIPASIILLSDFLTNGYCYDRALLASRAFLDDENVDVSLLYVSINSLRLNPKYVNNKNPMNSDHCVVEITFDTGKSFIIDTSVGFIYEKSLYWKIEKPKVRHINNKERIRQFLAEDSIFHPENSEKDKCMAPLILQQIENTFKRPTEMYAMNGIELLQREIEHYKQEINYDSIKHEMERRIKESSNIIFQNGQQSDSINKMNTAKSNSKRTVGIAGNGNMAIQEREER